MTEILRQYEVEVTALGGLILLEAPGVVATLDVEAASILSDQLLGACGLARLQQHHTIDQASNFRPAVSIKSTSDRITAVRSD